MHEFSDFQDTSPGGAPPVLNAIGLACERDQRRLFTDLSFQLHAGNMLRIRGPNGCGKSSLLRLLCGLTRPARGHVELFGQPMILHNGSLTSKLLWIGHAAGIKALLTTEENLIWLGTLHGQVPSDTIGRALDAVGLHGFEDTPCHALSAGQQRRVALARLYLPDAPAVWLLDEPFTALDTAGTAQLEAHLALHCGRGGTVVLTTHHELTGRDRVFVDLDLSQYAT